MLKSEAPGLFDFCFGVFIIANAGFFVNRFELLIPGEG